MADRLGSVDFKVGNFGCSDFPDLGFLPPDSSSVQVLLTVLLSWPQHFPLVLEGCPAKSSYLSPLDFWGENSASLTTECDALCIASLVYKTASLLSLDLLSLCTLSLPLNLEWS